MMLLLLYDDVSFPRTMPCNWECDFASSLRFDNLFNSSVIQRTNTTTTKTNKYNVIS